MEQKKLNTRVRRGEDTTKIRSAIWILTHQILLDDDVTFWWEPCLCLVLMIIFLCVSSFLPVLWPCHHQHRVVRAELFTDGHGMLSSAQRIFYFEALAVSRHNINLVFDEENMKPERLAIAPENAGIDPSTMRLRKWYQESTRENDDPLKSSEWPGADRMSYQELEPIRNDEDRLAMKRGDMRPPMPQRIANPRNREDQALQELHSKSDKMHRATSDEYFDTWFDMEDLSSHKLWRKREQLLNFSTWMTYHLGSFNRKSEFWKPENLNKPIAKSVKYNITDLTFLREFWWTKHAHVIMTAEADSPTTDAKQLLEDCGLVGCHSKKRELSVSPFKKWLGKIRLLRESNEEEDKG